MPPSLIERLAIGGPALALALALALADAAAKATIVLCLATAAATALRRSSAAVRHRLWGLALGALALLPILSWSLPGWRLPILPATMVSADSSSGRHEGGEESGASRAVGGGSPDGSSPTRPAFDRGRREPRQAPRMGQSEGRSATAPGSATAARPLIDPDAARREAIRIVLVWAFGFFMAAFPALAGVVGNGWRRRRSRRVTDPRWLQLLENLARQFAIRRRVELRTNPEPLIPITWGVVRPVVLLPEQAEQWPEPARRLVLLHELAHIKRRDVVFQLFGRMATAAYWFHPIAWYALHRMRVECECACDDHVVHLGVRRTDYARQLVDLARSLRAAVSSGAVPMARSGNLEQRIMVLLDDRRSHRLLGNRLAIALLGGALASVAGLAVIHPGRTEGGQLGIGPPTAPPATKTTARDTQKPGPPAAVALAPEKPPAARPEDSLLRSYTHPITVTGRAVDPTGRPVPGARVYLASRWADYKRVAETTTDAEGRYGFRGVPLPIGRADTVWGRDEGAFQVFGQAEGFGFAWRPQKWLSPRPKPSNIIYEPEHRDPPSRFEAGAKIELDLHFPPAARLSGTIADDLVS